MYRYTFDKAADHVYTLLLKKDCYPRFLRSVLNPPFLKKNCCVFKISLLKAIVTVVWGMKM
jgi:hypothetical protein